MAKKTTVAQTVLKTLGSRKGGFTDAELISKTGIAYANTVRAHLKKAGLVVVLGSKKDTGSNRTVKTWIAV